MKGSYYAIGSGYTRPDRPGKTYARTLGRSLPSLRSACRSIDSSDAPKGYVQLWIESEQRRVLVAERDEAGNWWARNGFTGNLSAFDPYAPKARAS